MKKICNKKNGNAIAGSSFVSTNTWDSTSCLPYGVSVQKPVNSNNKTTVLNFINEANLNQTDLKKIIRSLEKRVDNAQKAESKKGPSNIQSQNKQAALATNPSSGRKISNMISNIGSLSSMGCLIVTLAEFQTCNRAVTAIPRDVPAIENVRPQNKINEWENVPDNKRRISGPPVHPDDTLLVDGNFAFYEISFPSITLAKRDTGVISGSSSFYDDFFPLIKGAENKLPLQDVLAIWQIKMEARFGDAGRILKYEKPSNIGYSFAKKVEDFHKIVKKELPIPKGNDKVILGPRHYGGDHYELPYDFTDIY